jgi:hypothetical protein
MQTNLTSGTRSAWSGWAGFLRQHGLDSLAAWALDAAGPLTIFGAQALYIGAPLLRPALTDAQCEALAGLLEDRAEASAFAAFLREDGIL